MRVRETPSPPTPLPCAGEGGRPPCYNAPDVSRAHAVRTTVQDLTRQDGSPLPRTGECAGPSIPRLGIGGPVSHGVGVRASFLAALALLLATLPYIAGFAAAPRGTVFLGALNNVGDTGQYLAAIRQGMDAAGVSRLLYIDQYSSLRVAPVLMYPFYTVAGVVFSPFHPSVMAVYQLLHVLAAVALLGALWRFCRAVSPGGSPVLAYALALFGGGLYAPALLLSGVVRLPIAPVALTAPELSLFSTLLISPHGAAGLAAQLWALAGYLRWRRHGHARDLLALALGGLVLGLCYPFGIVVLVAVVAVDVVLSPRPPCGWRSSFRPPRPWLTGPSAAADGPARLRGSLGRGLPPDPRQTHISEVSGLGNGRRPVGLPPSRRVCLPHWRWLRSLVPSPLSPTAPLWRGSGGRHLPRLPRRGRGGRKRATFHRLWGAGGAFLALLPACAVALYYAVLFRHDPFWSGSAMLRLPLPSVALLIGAFGPLALLAAPALRSLAGGAYHGVEEGAGIRLAATWAVVTPVLLVAPLPQTERLLSGWSVALAVLGALTVRRLHPRAVVRVVAVLGCSNVMLALLYLAVTVHGANPAYYASLSEARAARWLAAHSGPNDVVMASAGSGNLIVSVAACHVVVGQNFETFDWAAAQRDVLRFYDATTTVAARAAIVRRQRVTLVMDGPYEDALGRYAPGRRGYRLVHQDGPVRVFAVTGAGL